MKPVIIGLIILSLFGISIFAFYRDSENPTINTPQPTVKASPTTSPSPEKVNITAGFKILTGQIVRNFGNPKYHNQSEDVYIQSSDPTLIYVTKSGITWGDFFQTLPMEVSRDCLITGDGETLCNGNGHTLKFFLNNNLTPDLLDKEIKDNDNLLINYQ